MHAFVQKVGRAEAGALLAPLIRYVQPEQTRGDPSDFNYVIRLNQRQRSLLVFRRITL
jgi:hypothetical protein